MSAARAAVGSDVPQAHHSLPTLQIPSLLAKKLVALARSAVGDVNPARNRIKQGGKDVKSLPPNV
ncbi:MAG: hypothetical protein U0M06_10140 [Clostridia bacterium]|nr:hypothetical protein [Clostridia bacterium]